MNWKQKGPSSWTALTRRFAGKFIIVQVAGNNFTVEHLSTPFLFGQGPRQARLKRNIGQAPSLSEAQAVAATFIHDEARWPGWPAEMVDA